MNAKKVGAVISVLLPVLLIFPIINFVFELMPNRLQGLPIFFPLFICPVGFILAFVSYKADKNKWSKVGMTLNTLLFLTPYIYMMGGALIFGA